MTLPAPRTVEVARDQPIGDVVVVAAEVLVDGRPAARIVRHDAGYDVVLTDLDGDPVRRTAATWDDAQLLARRLLAARDAATQAVALARGAWAAEVDADEPEGV